MTPSSGRRGAAIFPVTVLLLLTGVLGIWSARTGSLAQWAPATCLPDHCFCEAIGSGAVAQPANAWSSLAFVLAGLWIAQPSAGGKYKARNRMAGEPAYRRLYGCALVAIGLGSYFYHATLTFAGQVCDMSGMYLLITFALFYGVARITRLRTGVTLLSYVISNLVLLSFQVAFPDLRRYVFAALVLSVLSIEGRYRRASGTAIANRWLWCAAGAMAAAFLVWVLDITKAICKPESMLQGHALWHVLGALAAWCLYRYYQSEVVLR
jgi:hypothetical protein